MAGVSEEGARYFAWEDYAVFSAMLVVSAAIGVYFGFVPKKKKRQNKDAEDLLIGGGKMKTVPVALSMLAGFLSSITLMGQPAEVYLFGPQLWLFGFGCFLAIPIVNSIVIPFFRGIKVTSAYEYFGRRFNRKFQVFASTIFTIQIVLFLALVLYAPALALQQVTGLNTYVIVTAMYIVCIFYTTVGGIRAVIWTDTFQVFVLYSALIAIIIKGTLDLGGVRVVFEKNARYSRDSFFNFDVNPTVRYSVWSSLIGGACVHLFVSAGNQLQIQRFLSVSSINEARKTVWIYAIGWSAVASLTAYSGMLIFAKYSDCDPLSTRKITTADQLFPFFVMDVLAPYKGFPGLFLAGIFSAGLSTVSSGLNSLAAIWYAELHDMSFCKFMSSIRSDIQVQLLALFFGLVSFAMVFLVPYMGALVPVAMSLTGFFSGALTGIFCLGAYFPAANTWGAFCGLLAGIIGPAWLTIGAQLSAANGLAVYHVLPLSTSGCLHNKTLASTTSAVAAAAPAAYRVSFLWYSLVAFILALVVGALVSSIASYARSFSLKQINKHVQADIEVVRCETGQR